MSTKDKFFLFFGGGVGIVGIVATILWSVEAGVVALITISLVILTLLALQRRQLARVQQRTLSMLNTLQTTKPVTVPKPPSDKESIAIPTKKIVGLLQAQQMNLDLLNSKVETYLNRSSSNSNHFE